MRLNKMQGALRKLMRVFGRGPKGKIRTRAQREAEARKRGANASFPDLVPGTSLLDIRASDRASYANGPSVTFSAKQLSRTEPYTGLLFGQKLYGERFAALQELADDPDPEAEAALILVLQTPTDPLGALALPALLALGTGPSLDAIRAAVRDPRRTIHGPALLHYVLSGRRDAPKLCRRLFGPDGSLNLRAIAALGLGELEVHSAADDLREALNRDFPRVRLCAAWALWRLGDPAGRRWLEQLSMSGDPGLSTQAIGFLRAIGDRQSARAYIDALGDESNAIWLSAFAALQEMREADLSPWLMEADAVIRREPTGRRSRRLVLLFLDRANTGVGTEDRAHIDPEAFQKATATSARVGSDRERRLLASVLAERGKPEGIDPLVMALEEAGLEHQKYIAEQLRTLATPLAAFPPPESSSATRWRRWWLRSCYAERVRDRASKQTVTVLRSPGGVAHFASAGVQIVEGVEVVAVREKEGAPVVTATYRSETFVLRARRGK